MSKVITFSRTFPSYHPQAGEPTYFVEKFLQWYWDSFDLPYYSLCELIERMNPGKNVEDFVGTLDTESVQIHKNHTIRAGNRFKAGDKFSPRVWGTDINPKSGRCGPYHSKQIILAPDMEVKKVWDFKIYGEKSETPFQITVDGFVVNDTSLSHYIIEEVAKNDGLTMDELMSWFKYPKPFTGQIICWNETVNY